MIFRAGLLCALLAGRLLCQESAPVFRSEVVSALLWGNGNAQCEASGCEFPGGGHSRQLKDPLTGQTIHQLFFNGVEVSSQLGVEGQWVRTGRRDSIRYATFVIAATVINNTEHPIAISFGGARYTPAFGASITSGFLPDAGLATFPRLERKFEEFSCFVKGVFEKNILITRGGQANIVQPQSSIKFNVITGTAVEIGKLAPLDGTGEYRYSFRIDNKDFVFPWRYGYETCGPVVQ